MKRIGNAESNRTYNPRNVKPRLPVDVDETDSAMERYIRKKYEQRVYMDDARNPTRHDTAEDRPPPLPPKPSKGFGFGLRKSATSPRDLTPPVSPGFGSFERDASPPRVNKPSRVFGSNIQTSGDGLDSKLATLRDMGFPDDRRNSTVLKGLNGNLDRTVEALIRLGEQNSGKSEGSTPNPPAKSNANGLTFDRTQTAPATSASNNNSRNPHNCKPNNHMPDIPRRRLPVRILATLSSRMRNQCNTKNNRTFLSSNSNSKPTVTNRMLLASNKVSNTHCKTCNSQTKSLSSRSFQTVPAVMGLFSRHLRKQILSSNRSRRLLCRRYPSSTALSSSRNRSISLCLRLQAPEILF
jgi:hypothetical protein